MPLLRRKPLGQLVQEEVLVSVQVMQGNSQTEHVPLVRKELGKQVRQRVELVASQDLQFDDFLQGLHLPFVPR